MSTPASGLARLLPAPVASRWDTLARVWLAATLCVALWTFGDYGVTWDEAPHMHYGDLVGRYYISGFQEDGALDFRTNYYYGGGYDALGAVFRVNPDGEPAAIAGPILWATRLSGKLNGEIPRIGPRGARNA